MKHRHEDKVKRVLVAVLLGVVLLCVGCINLSDPAEKEYFDAGFYDANALDYIGENVTVVKFMKDATDVYIKAVISNMISFDGRVVTSIVPFNYQNNGEKHQIRYVYIIFAID